MIGVDSGCRRRRLRPASTRASLRAESACSESGLGPAVRPGPCFQAPFRGPVRRGPAGHGSHRAGRWARAAGSPCCPSGARASRPRREKGGCRPKGSASGPPRSWRPGLAHRRRGSVAVGEAEPRHRVCPSQAARAASRPSRGPRSRGAGGRGSFAPMSVPAPPGTVVLRAAGSMPLGRWSGSDLRMDGRASTRSPVPHAGLERRQGRGAVSAARRRWTLRARRGGPVTHGLARWPGERQGQGPGPTSALCLQRTQDELHIVSTVDTLLGSPWTAMGWPGSAGPSSPASRFLGVRSPPASAPPAAAARLATPGVGPGRT